MSLDARDFGYIQDLMRVRSGILLEEGKEYLAESRLHPIADEAGYGSVAELVRALKISEPAGLHLRVVEALTINETSFFRDFHVFQALGAFVLPALIEARRVERALRIWSAGCASGQEPYSVAMLLRDGFPEIAGWDVLIEAGDLSEMMVERTRAGVYSQLEVNRGLPAPMLLRHFGRAGLDWEIDGALRESLLCRRRNLADPWPDLPPQDLVFLRNVLIYLDNQTRRSILGRVRRLLRSDGWLVLGAAETLSHFDSGFETVGIGGVSFFRPL